LPGQKAYFKQYDKGPIEENFPDTFGLTPFWNETKGLFISAITSKTPAEKQGLKVGDKILSLNDKDVSKMTKDDFCELLLNFSTKFGFDKKKALKITIQRGNKNIKKFILVKK